MMFPTKGSKTIWVSKDGRQTPVDKLNEYHLSNIYELLWNITIEIVQSQAEIDKYTLEAYPGRLNINFFDRAHAFLTEFCPTWNEIWLRSFNLGICHINGESKRLIKRKSTEEVYSGEYTFNKSKESNKVNKRNGGKVVTDSTGKQYLLFEIE